MSTGQREVVERVMDSTTVGFKMVEMEQMVYRLRDLLVDRDLVPRDQCDQDPWCPSPLSITRT